MRPTRWRRPGAPPSAAPFLLGREPLAVLTGTPRDERVHNSRERCIAWGCNSGPAHAPGEHPAPSRPESTARGPPADPSSSRSMRRCLLSADVVIQWNQAVLAAIRNDKPDDRLPDARPGARAVGDLRRSELDPTIRPAPFSSRRPAPADSSPVAGGRRGGAVTASALFPTDTALFQATYQSALAGIPDGQARPTPRRGAIHRRADPDPARHGRSQRRGELIPRGPPPGDWRPYAGRLRTGPDAAMAVRHTPFRPDQRLSVPPGPAPGVDQPEYTARLHEVKALGRADSTTRTAQQTDIAKSGRARPGTPQIAGYWNEITQERGPVSGATRSTRTPVSSPN